MHIQRMWDIVLAWNPFWQGVFLFFVSGLLATFACQVLHYAAVMIQGWPPEYEDEEENGGRR